MTLLTLLSSGIPVSTVETWDRYATLTTGIEFRSRIGDRINPRSYCDDASLGPVALYINKEPVCMLKLTPTTQFASTNIAWDISASGSATSTVSKFNIEWGGTTDIGDLTDRDFASDPTSGNVQYSSTGTYQVEAYVEDLLGTRSKRCRTTININEFVNLQRCYIFTTDGGMYILEPGDDPLAANGGLTGNHTNFRAGRMHPVYKGLPTEQHHLWGTTQDGVVYSLDGKDTSWNLISEATLGTPVNDAGDSPAPVAADPDNIDICFDPQDPSTIVVLRTTATRTWIYTSTDYGVTWSNEQVSI